MPRLTTFPARGEFEKAVALLESLGAPFQTLSPEPAFCRVGVPAIIVEPEAQAELQNSDIVCSGWVDYRPPASMAPATEPMAYEEDVFGTAAIMVLAPCVADPMKIRFIAHISGDLAEVFPYMNAVMERASFNPDGPTFTYMDRYRMVSVYPRRVAVAKADEIVDAWRVLEALRVHANEAWARRAEIKPSWETRERPPAIEILKRLPRTNCGACGEPTCLAFAVKGGLARPPARGAPPGGRRTGGPTARALDWHGKGVNG